MPYRTPAILFGLLAGVLLPALALSQTLRMDTPFGSHMVLQRQMPLRFSGLAAPHAELRLQFAGMNRVTHADAQGSWQLSFPALPAGGPHTLEVQAGTESLSLEDILVGEVWLASGQSNMEWSLGMSAGAEAALQDASQQGTIRLFSVERDVSQFKGAWQKSSADTARGFSGVAWHFGRELQRALKVPVGLVAAPWSGTPIETWVPDRSLQDDRAFAAVLERWKARPLAEQGMYSMGWDFKLEIRKLRLIPKDPHARPLDIDARKGWMVDAAPGAKTRMQDGYYTGNLPTGTWANASRAFNAKKTDLDLNAYLALTFEARGNSRFEPCITQSNIQDSDQPSLPEFTATADWKQQRFELKDLKQGGWGRHVDVDLSKAAGLGFRVRAPNQFPDQPGLLFETMIQPLAPLTMRGAIWYQGESNAGRASEYAALLKALVLGWRQGLKQPELSFLVVQLPEYGPKDSSQTYHWADLREAQASILSLPNAGMAVTLGLGDAKATHPVRKKEVGQRLAWEALGLVYGHAGMSGRGPELSKIIQKKDGLHLRFSSAAGGLSGLAGPDLKGFEAGGVDGIFRAVPAKIKGGEVIVPVNLPKTAMLRYAWADDPDADLSDSRSLPALPFKVSLP